MRMFHFLKVPGQNKSKWFTYFHLLCSLVLLYQVIQVNWHGLLMASNERMLRCIRRNKCLIINELGLAHQSILFVWLKLENSFEVKQTKLAIEKTLNCYLPLKRLYLKCLLKKQFPLMPEKDILWMKLITKSNHKSNRT